MSTLETHYVWLSHHSLIVVISHLRKPWIWLWEEHLLVLQELEKQKLLRILVELLVYLLWYLTVRTKWTRTQWLRYLWGCANQAHGVALTSSTVFQSKCCLSYQLKWKHVWMHKRRKRRNLCSLSKVKSACKIPQGSLSQWTLVMQGVQSCLITWRHCSDHAPWLSLISF